MEVDICKFISNLRKPLFFLTVSHCHSYPFRDLYFAHGKFYLSVLNCFTHLLYFSSLLVQGRTTQCFLLYTHSCTVSQALLWKQKYSLSNLPSIFFSFFKWLLKYHPMHRIFLFDQRSRYGFSCCSNLTTENQFLLLIFWNIYSMSLFSTFLHVKNVNKSGMSFSNTDKGDRCMNNRLQYGIINAIISVFAWGVLWTQRIECLALEELKSRTVSERKERESH